MLGTMTVSTRLAIAFGLVIILMFGLAAAGVSGLATLNRQVDALANNKMPQVIATGKWEAAVLQTARHMRNVFILPDPASVKEELKAIHVNKQERAVLMEHLQKLVATERQRAMLKTIVDARSSYIPHEDEFLRLAEAGNMEEARRVMLDKARPAQLVYIDSIDKLVGQLEADSKEAAVAAAATYRSSLAGIGIAALLALLAAAVVATLISRSIRRQLGGEPAYAASIANSIAAGDLTANVEVPSHDRTSMMYAMARMSEKLRQLIGQVAEGARVVADTSEQISQGNIDLSQRTEEQASSLEETASQMEELTSTVTQNADNARQASQLASEASDVARRGGQLVQEVVTTMNGISESSKKISDIIGVIDGIAFQTNILALNAAVEAARAGEQGRGFAVVATEVRNLAQRSAQAAKEIKGLIGDSVGKVDAGSKLVDAAGHRMQEIVVSVQKVSDLVSEIAAASQEQSAGIEQVNSAVTQMDQVVQQNASLVEEAAAATASMREQASSLLQVVGRFRLGEDGAWRRSPEIDPLRALAEPSTAVPITVRPSLRLRQVPPAAHVTTAHGSAGNGDSWREF